MKSVIAYRSLLLIVLLFLSSCGFHLRGSIGDLTWHIQSVHIQSEAADRIARELKSRLIEQKLQVLPTSEAAQVIVYLSNETVDRRVLSVSSVSGKQEEIELNYRVEIKITKVDDTVILEKHTISFLRDYRFDPEAVLAAGGEEEILREDMFNQIVMQIIRQLQRIKITEENQK
jgi:LPS-assembly lipoprotein